jgi:hypothetical protein
LQALEGDIDLAQAPLPAPGRARPCGNRHAVADPNVFLQSRAGCVTRSRW